MKMQELVMIVDYHYQFHKARWGCFILVKVHSQLWQLSLVSNISINLRISSHISPHMFLVYTLLFNLKYVSENIQQFHNNYDNNQVRSAQGGPELR